MALYRNVPKAAPVGGFFLWIIQISAASCQPRGSWSQHEFLDGSPRNRSREPAQRIFGPRAAALDRWPQRADGPSVVRRLGLRANMTIKLINAPTQGTEHQCLPQEAAGFSQSHDN